MSTAMQELLRPAGAETMARPTPGRPTAEAIEAYRASVISGKMDVATLAAAWKIEAEWRKDRATYEVRLARRRDLDVLLPELEAKATEAKERLERSGALAGMSIAGLDVDALVGQLRDANPELGDVGTLADLAGAVLLHVRSIEPRLKNAAWEAGQRVQTLRETAERALIDSASRTLHSEHQSLGHRMASLGGAITARQPVLDAEQEIERCKHRLCEFAAGRDPDRRGLMWVVGGGEREPEPIPVLYRKARARLDELMALAARREEAEQANATDREAIAELQKQQAAVRERMLQPEQMRWSG